MIKAIARNLGNAFGAGMGTMEGTCGALVGAGIVLGMATKDRAAARKGMRQIMIQFLQRNGATQCKLLKGVGTGVVLRECTGCVADAAELLEEQLMLRRRIASVIKSINQSFIHSFIHQSALSPSVLRISLF